MVIDMMFVGATVEELLSVVTTTGESVDDAAKRLLGQLDPIGEPFDIPWKFGDALDVFGQDLPTELRRRLATPGDEAPANHLEACAVALALEAGVMLQPLSPNDIRRLQHCVVHTIEQGSWGRQSPHPWDSFADAVIDDYDFFALSIPE